MKNQYFGDNRDLFKYDLIYQIIKAGLVRHITFIPMLTENDDTKQGGERNRDKAKAGTKNSDLVEFLNELGEKTKRDVRQLKSYFQKKGIKMTIYKEGDYFSDDSRLEYFKQIGNELLSKSLVFVDPDIGLEVKRTRDKHIKYLEVKSLYERIDKNSILMIYQHFPRVSHQEYLNRRCTEIKETVTRDWPICIDDNEVAFFFLTKDESLEHSLTHVISDYAELYS